ncbi:Type I restriction enzyme EcoR124II R protein [Collinsella aerofaciens]|nr:Type I restriction enzyme EcoR124II R protein [Collinsella aerofaciens]
MTIVDSVGGAAAPSYSVLLEGPESTVCAEAPAAAHDSTAYQSEAELEDELIAQLIDQGYEYADITDEAALIANLRDRIERLNGFAFTDPDWERFFRTHVAAETDGIVEKTRRIQ